MEKKDIIDIYIDNEKKIEPSPYLNKRIMTSIQSHKLSLRHKFAIAASIIVVIASGILLGTQIANDTNEMYALNINDSNIENLHMYESVIE